MKQIQIIKQVSHQVPKNLFLFLLKIPFIILESPTLVNNTSGKSWLKFFGNQHTKQ